jgi:serine phosphatase RsbU (regulator of sigma subunit)
MREGDVVVIYTDGIVEAADKNDKLFGLEKLCSLVERNHEFDAEDIRNLILAEVDSHTSGSSQTDDITVVVLKRV